MKGILKLVLWVIFLVGIFILITNIWVVRSTQSQIYFDEDVPKNQVALVLGTSKRTKDGLLNQFFIERMQAAALLYQLDKVRHVLVSGDNSTIYYNEPRDMLKALDDLNIPVEDISLDFAGFRTLDSVVRAQEIFDQESVTIVTQEFHCYRSLFIANHFGIEAVAFSADDGGHIGYNLAMREVLARTIAVIDLYILKKKPKYLGQKIELIIE